MARLTGMPLEERFKVNELTGCWIYRGFLDAEGYGRVGNRMAHRVYFEAFRGPVERRLDLDHLCVRRNCVNPDHLEAVTPAENQLRGASYRPLDRSETTHCHAGHRYEEGSFSWVKDKSKGSRYAYRRCLVCRRAARKAKAAKAKGVGLV